jgi:2-haloacid dehalogenase
MPHRNSVSIIVFDVNETLLDITTLEPLFDRVYP